MKKALLLIDIQNDFCESGKLAVKEASQIIPVCNQLQSFFDFNIATKDWHPTDHLSFASNHPSAQVGDKIFLGNISQILWPDHCVQETWGAEFHPDLNTSLIDITFYKGIDKHIDSYSAFFDNAWQRTTGLEKYLREKNVESVYVAGLATDYCVKYTALDALKLGFDTYVVIDACRGVNLQSDDTERALDEIVTKGGKVISFQHCKINAVS